MLHHSQQHQQRDTAGQNLLKATILNITITAVELVGGLLSNSFALLSDALHNFGDAIAVFLAYISNKISKRPPHAGQTFGTKRIEIIAAMFNGLIMLVICGYLFVEAYHRLRAPEPINGLLMIIIATIGLLANLWAVFFLRRDKDHNLNVKAAYVHLLADTLSSVAVVIGGIFIYFFEIWWLDPLLSFVIGIYILKETWYIIKQAYLILMQATPPGMDLKAVKAAIETIEEVENIHHVHVWQLNDEQIHFECHADLSANFTISETEPIYNKIKKLLHDGFDISHTTIQFEYNCCDNKDMVYK